MDNNPIPEGYMQNATGDLVRIENVREHDKLRNQVAIELAEKAKAISQQLAEYKRQAMADIEDLISIAAEKYGKSLGGKKGNVTILSYDGRYKIQRVYAQNISFTEELKAAEALFLDCIENWSEHANNNLRLLIDSAFKTNKNGQIRTAELLKLLRIDIKDAHWLKACEALKDSILITGSTLYIRVYQRIGKTDQYQQIPLDVAGISVNEEPAQ